MNREDQHQSTTVDHSNQNQVPEDREAQTVPLSEQPARALEQQLLDTADQLLRAGKLSQAFSPRV